MQSLKSMKRLILLLVLIPSISISFASRYNSLLKDFEASSQAKETQISRYIELSRSFIDLITIYGNEYFQQGENKDSDIYSLLKYDQESDSFNLDAVKGTKYESIVGNLTGIGKIPKEGMYREELNLALKYNEFFNNFYDRLEDVQWLYYTSENGFINIYPWVSSKEFTYKESLRSVEFYTFANPKNNPHRRAIWTPVYIDQAGKGPMVTLSSPIYNNGIFMGVVSLDLTTNKLKEIISTNYESYLLDFQDSVIAADLNINHGDELHDLDSLLGDRNGVPDEKTKIKSNTIQRIGSHYVYPVVFESVPWKLFFRVPVELILIESALFVIPILIIGILLLFTIYEFEKSKSTEILLANSLEELKSYQERLENAAKYDMLTNTYNRRGLNESFNTWLEANRIRTSPISFIIADIDHFKQFNDTFGHAAGDKVLIVYASLFKKDIGSEDILCRWGGEEFVIVMFGKTCKEALVVAEKIRNEVENLIIPWENSIELKGTMTFGISGYNYIDTIEDCVTKADIALYFGKNNGRNQVNGYRDCITS